MSDLLMNDYFFFNIDARRCYALVASCIEKRREIEINFRLWVGFESDSVDAGLEHILQIFQWKLNEQFGYNLIF